jgi:DNA mismatch repair protein MutL
MPDIIHLLPDSVANQIAAGEVIQRPASVVKELMENSIDSGSTEIKIFVKDAGKTLIQVIDNGCGMSETDARLAFERHATSKIFEAKDLFAIQTMGFRGEALASIAAIAHVELKTKRIEDELGTQILIYGSKVEKQESISCPDGSNFTVKNLFFNVPARRKFLKTNSTELKHIIIEFQRIALSHPNISFSLHQNETEIYNLPESNLPKRLMGIFGKGINQNLVPLSVETSLAKINGYIGKPEFARKTFGEQFFFVNNRYVKHPYLHRAVLKAYDQILLPETIPAYFIYFVSDPETIDINIHPTKSEVKFEDETSIWQILLAATREALGKFSIVPSIDFDNAGVIDIPVSARDKELKPPTIRINPDFDPFKKENTGYQKKIRISQLDKENLQNWEKLYSGFEKNKDNVPSEQALFQKAPETKDETIIQNLFQLKNKYIICLVKSGLMVIDQKRAHERILYEKYLDSLEKNLGVAQKDLFPQTIELSASDHITLSEILDELSQLGFDIQDLGHHSVVINGYPVNSGNSNPKEMIEILLKEYKASERNVQTGIKERIAKSLAIAAAINYGNNLTKEEMREIIDSLFACRTPNYSPSGKPVVTIISLSEIENMFG